VSPEHRKRGVAESLMRSALREMRQRGNAFSLLYAFRGSFYRKFGYGVIEHVHPLAFAPANLPASDEMRRVRRLMLPDRPAVQALYERVASQGHWALERRREWWSERLWTYPGDWIVYEGRRRGQIEGYLHYEADASQGPFRLALTLDEFVAASPEAHRGLVGYLASLADQVNEIHFAAPADTIWLSVLKTAQNLRAGVEIGVFLDTGGVAAGAMLRVTDVKAALEGFPVSASARGEVALEIEDAILPANARVWRMSAREGRLHVSAESARAGTRRRLPRLVVPAEFLGPILAGTLPPTRAAEAGLIGSSDGAEVIEAWFRGRTAYLYPLNGF
jgi:predicted acetyltransferase